MLRPFRVPIRQLVSVVQIQKSARVLQENVPAPAARSRTSRMPETIRQLATAAAILPLVIVHLDNVFAADAPMPTRSPLQALTRPLASVEETTRTVLVRLGSVLARAAPSNLPLDPTRSQFLSSFHFLLSVSTIRPPWNRNSNSKFFISFGSISISGTAVLLVERLLTTHLYFSATHSVATEGTEVVDSSKVAPLEPEKGTYA